MSKWVQAVLSTLGNILIPAYLVDPNLFWTEEFGQNPFIVKYIMVFVGFFAVKA